MNRVSSLCFLLLAVVSNQACAGFDHELPLDQNGIWARSYQTRLQNGVIALEVAGSLWYGRQDPWVWALEALPAYDALARLKSQAHWQTDVIAGWALGTGVGYWSTTRAIPLSVQLLPGGLSGNDFSYSVPATLLGTDCISVVASSCFIVRPVFVIRQHLALQCLAGCQRMVFIARIICPRTARSKLMSSELIGSGSATSRPTRMQAMADSPDTMGSTTKLAVPGHALAK